MRRAGPKGPARACCGMLRLCQDLDGAAIRQTLFLFKEWRHVGSGKMVPERLDALPLFEDRDHVLIEDLRRQAAVEIRCGHILDAALLLILRGVRPIRITEGTPAAHLPSRVRRQLRKSSPCLLIACVSVCYSMRIRA